MADLDLKYTAVVTADDGRTGRAVSDDGALDLTLTPPATVLNKVPAMRSTVPETTGTPGTNPEQLLAAAYASNFHGALGAVGKAAGLDTTDSTVTASVGLGKYPDGAMGFTLELCVSVPRVDAETALKMAEGAATIDAFVTALKGNIDVKLSVA